MSGTDDDFQSMQDAIGLARQGEGLVEPNPMVGCVIVRQGERIGKGWHGQFGGPHAEIMALRAAGDRARDAVVYVTLEPCCHQGKTPPCTQALVAARPRRVVVAVEDPFPEVAGRGIEQLRAAGIQVDVGLAQDDARALVAPYLKCVTRRRPWILAKWAMTLDGRIATETGESRWISSPQSRELVHRLRGRVDAIMVGRGTAERDDPLLTARPPGPRTATRIVVDTHASLPLGSQLVRTAQSVPLLVATAETAADDRCRRLESAGAEVVRFAGQSPADRLTALLDELGQRQMTNLLVEGGAELLGSLLDQREIDEVHVFVAAKLLGGRESVPPTRGKGIHRLGDAVQLSAMDIQPLGNDAYLTGRIER